MIRRELLAAGIIRDYLFCDIEEFEVYVSTMQHRKIGFKVLETFERNDGTVIARVLTSYNSSDLIQL